jgi:hypothetical protein
MLKMLASDLIERLQEVIADHGNLLVFDWDNDEITTIDVRRAETIAYGYCPIAVTSFPDRIVVKQ